MIIADRKYFQLWLDEVASTIPKLYKEVQRCEGISSPKQTFVSLMNFQTEQKLSIDILFHQFLFPMTAAINDQCTYCFICTTACAFRLYKAQVWLNWGA